MAGVVEAGTEGKCWSGSWSWGFGLGLGGLGLTGHADAYDGYRRRRHAGERETRGFTA